MLPSAVLNGIRDIFIPDTVEIENSFNAFLDTLKMKFNFNTDFFQNVLTDGAPVEDVNKDYHIHGVGTMNLKFFDSSFLYDGVEYFRPFIRGFLVLLMAFYNVKQVLSFIRQDAGVVTGKMASGKGD